MGVTDRMSIQWFLPANLAYFRHWFLLSLDPADPSEIPKHYTPKFEKSKTILVIIVLYRS